MDLLAAISFNRPDWLWPCAAIVAAALVLLAIRYGRAREMPGRIRFAAALLKLTGIALLCLCLLDVQWTDRQPEKGANFFLLLADGSRGMGIRDTGSDETRAGILATALRRGAGVEDRAEGWQGALENLFQVRRYAFGDRLESKDHFEDLSFDAASSDLGNALKVLRERHRNRPVAGILVFSDGNATDLASPGDLGEATLEGCPPIFPVIVGSDAPVRDLAIRDVRVNQTVFEDAPVTIEADVQCSGYKGETVVLELLDEEGKSAGAQPHVVASDDDAHRFRLRLKPVKSGVLFYTLNLKSENGIVPAANPGDEDSGAGSGGALAGDPAEATLENNRRVVVVDRPKGPYRVLYVSGRPSWEYKFLRRALEPDPQVQLTGLVRLAKREPKFQWRGREGESSNPLFRGFGNDDPEEEAGYDQPVLVRLGVREGAEDELRDGFPSTPETLFANYQAIILDDVEAAFFSTAQMELIDSFVSRRGGGFLMAGGQECFQPGEYDNTPIAHLLPVYLDRLSDFEPARELTLELTREGWLEPWLRLRELEEQERVRLDEMPAFRVLNQVRAIKPGASVLATVTDPASVTRPALVGHRFGAGRALAMTIGDFWRWGMRDEKTRPDMEKAWRQIVRWLLADVPDPFAFEARADGESAIPGSGIAAARSVQLEVRLRDEKFEPRDNALVSINVIEQSEPDKQTGLIAEPSMLEPGLYESQASGKREGVFRATATARLENGEVVGSRETGWTVDLAAAEFRNLAPNRELMAGLAAATGGEPVSLENLDGFVRGLKNRRAPVMEVRSKPLWHAPWVFLAALLCFALEWGLRRRWGMT